MWFSRVQHYTKSEDGINTRSPVIARFESELYQRHSSYVCHRRMNLNKNFLLGTNKALVPPALRAPPDNQYETTTGDGHVVVQVSSSRVGFNVPPNTL